MPALQPGGVRTPSVRASCVRVASAWSKAGSGYARLQHPGFGLRPFGASWVRVPSVCSILGSRSVRLQRSGGCLRSPAAIRVLFFHPSRSARVRLPSIHAGKNNVGSCFIHLEAKNGPRWTEHEPDFCKWTKVEPALPACSTRCMQAGPLYAGSPRCMHIKITDNNRSNYAPKSIVRPILPWWSL